jgi:hypothetical protein
MDAYQIFIWRLDVFLCAGISSALRSCKTVKESGHSMGCRVISLLSAILAGCLLVFAAAGASFASATFVIDTTAEEDPSLGITSFGVPDTVIYGQTVKVPEGFALLSSYAFRMEDTDNLIFRGAVYAYTPGALPGEPLWVGPQVQLGTSRDTVLITFTPNLRLDPGTTYVIGATTLYDLDQPSGGSEWKVAPDEAYPDGSLTFFNQIGDTSWATGFAIDMSFTATFTATGDGSDSSAVLPPVEHLLGFNANGGTCSLTSSGLIIDGVWTQVPTAQQCSRPGFTLLGWNPRADGGDPLGFDPGGWTVMTGDNVLYAIWVPAS